MLPPPQRERPYRAEDIAQIAVMACFALIFLAVNLPCMFRLGVEKGRLLFMAMIGIIVFLVVGFGDNIVEGINTAYAGGSLAPGAVAIAALRWRRIWPP